MEQKGIIGFFKRIFGQNGLFGPLEPHKVFMERVDAQHTVNESLSPEAAEEELQLKEQLSDKTKQFLSERCGLAPELIKELDSEIFNFSKGSIEAATMGPIKHRFNRAADSGDLNGVNEIVASMRAELISDVEYEAHFTHQDPEELQNLVDRLREDRLRERAAEAKLLQSRKVPMLSEQPNSQTPMKIREAPMLAQADEAPSQTATHSRSAGMPLR